MSARPIPYALAAEVAHAPEVDAMAAQFVEPAVEAAREWRELERLLVQMTVAERREVLVFARARGAK